MFDYCSFSSCWKFWRTLWDGYAITVWSFVWATEYYIIEACDSSRSMLLFFKVNSLFFPFSGAKVEGTDGAIILAKLASYSSENCLVSLFSFPSCFFFLLIWLKSIAPVYFWYSNADNFIISFIYWSSSVSSCPIPVGKELLI